MTTVQEAQAQAALAQALDNLDARGKTPERNPAMFPTLLKQELADLGWNVVPAPRAPEAAVEYTLDFKYLSSDGMTRYDLTINHEGNITCSCPGFRYRHTCRHIKEFAATLPTGGGR